MDVTALQTKIDGLQTEIATDQTELATAQAELAVATVVNSIEALDSAGVAAVNEALAGDSENVLGVSLVLPALPVTE